MNTQLVKYEAACRAIAECKSVDEVKSWADKAAAMQAYGRMAQDKTLEVDAAEIRIRAERRLGEMLAAQKADGGLAQGVRMAGAKPGANDGSSVVVADDRRPKPTLADAGISKDLSSRAQKLAAVPADEFESALAEKRDRDRKEGARVSAKLEKAGAKVLRERKADADDEGPSKAELEDARRSAEDDAEAVRLLLDSDDKLAALADKCKQQAALIRTLEERIRGLTNESAQAIRLAKSWRTKCEKLEKAAA